MQALGDAGAQGGHGLERRARGLAMQLIAQLGDGGGEIGVVIVKGGEELRLAEYLVEARGAFQRTDLLVQVLRQARGLHAFEHQTLAKGGEPAHLDGGMHDRCQQRHRDHTDPQQQKAVQ